MTADELMKLLEEMDCLHSEDDEFGVCPKEEIRKAFVALKEENEKYRKALELIGGTNGINMGLCADS